VCLAGAVGNASEVYQYDPSNDSWSLKAAYPAGNTVGGVGFSINNTGYIGTGSFTKSIYLYTSPDADVIKPVINCPSNQTLNLDASCNAMLPDYRNLVSATDNATPTDALVITQNPAAGSTLNGKGSLIVTFTVTDASNNSSTCTISVDKKDVTPPVMTCTAPITVSNTPNTCGAVVNYINPAATDNCTGGAFNFFTQGEPNNYPNIYNAGEDYIQLYTSGKWNDLPNYSLNHSLVEFNSIISTVFNGYSLVGTFGGHTYYYSTAVATWTDSRTAAQAIGGDLASINTLEESAFLAPKGGDTWVGGYQDKTVPGFSEPGDATQNYLGWKWVDGTNLGAGQIVITQTAGLPSGSVFPVGVTTNTFTATDESGNTSTCSFTVTVKDQLPPVITCPAPISVNNTANTCGAMVNYINPKATDDCTGSAFNFFSSNEPNNYPNIYNEGEDYIQLFANGTWNDLPNYVLNRSIVEFNSIISTVFTGYNLIGTFGGHTYYYSTAAATWTASRAAAQSIGGDLVSINTLAESQYLAPYGGDTWVGGYQDKSVPGFREPGDASQNYLGWKWVDGTQLGAGQITITQIAGLPSGSTFPVGVTTNTFRATDESGNSSTCSFTVTVTDNQAPTISCPANQTVNATSAAGAVVTYVAPVGTDNCSGASIVRTSGLASGSTFPIGTTTVTHTVTDGAGLTAVCSFNVTVIGHAPVVACPSNITVGNDVNQCSAIVNFAATETTGIPASTITYNIQPGTIFAIGTTSVTATATNAIGTSICTFTITVTDTQLPNVVAQNVTVYLDNNGQASITAAQVNNGSSDNCGIATMTVSPSNFTCADIPPPVTTNTQTLISDNTWAESTTSYSTGNYCLTGIWNGVSSPMPSLGSYSIVPTINAYSVTPIPGTMGLYGLNGVRFFRKTFNLVHCQVSRQLYWLRWIMGSKSLLTV